MQDKSAPSSGFVALIWVAAVAVAATIGMSAWHVVSVERAKAEGVAGETLLRLSTTLAGNADALFAKAEYQLIQAAEALASTVPEHAAVVGLQRRFGQAVPAEDEPGVVVFVGFDGEGLAPIGARERRFVDFPEVAEALAGDPGRIVFGPVRLSPRLGTHVVPIAKRVRPNVHGVAVALIAVPLDALLDLLAAVQLPVNGTATLLTADGRLLARHPLDIGQLGRQFRGPAAEAFQHSRTGLLAGRSPIDGVERIVAFHRVGERPIFALVTVGRAELLGLERTKELVIFVLAACLAAGTLAGAGLLARQLARDARHFAEMQRAREEAERIAARLREMRAAIAVTDPEGRILWTNPAFSALTGLPAALAEGAPLRTLLDEEKDARDRTAELLVALHDGQPFDGILRVRKTDGTAFWARCVGAALPHGQDRSREHYLLVLADATEQVLAAEAAERTERLGLLGRLAGSVAHDANNLLAVIALNLELLADTPLDGEQRELLEAALGAARRGTDLTRPLLAFAQRSVDARRSVDLYPTLERLAPLLRKAMPRGIELVTELGCMGTSRGDEGGLESAVTNLVLNARDALAERGEGRIVLSCRRVDLDAAMARRLDIAPGAYAALTVEDDGPGMEPEILKRVLEPFFTTKGEKGSGLGLPSAYGFARQCGGTLVLDSAPGKGTRATLYLPLLEAEVPRATAEDCPAVAADAASLRDCTVLVVEDDPQALLGLQRVLQGQGMQVFSALDEDQALARLGVTSPDLLVLDIKLGHRANGIDLARRIRTVLPRVPIVFVTGDPGPHFEEKLAGLSSVQVVQKPYRREELLAAIRRVLRQSPPLLRGSSLS